MQPSAGLSGQIAQVRLFNRFYTGRIGVLRERLLGTPFSLTQARVLYELGARPGQTSVRLCQELGLDPGYLSRLLKSFSKQGLILRKESPQDRRAAYLSLTPKGRKAFSQLNQLSESEVAGILNALDPADRKQLVDAMDTIQRLLGKPAQDAPVRLRSHQPGDIGWVIARHGENYAGEYDWDVSFEGLVAEIAGKFLTRFQPAWERCWIAERAGQRLGSVFLVRHSRNIAQLRLLLVEPEARGLGVGTELVGSCLEFARERGYRKVMLWTNHILHAARRIYLRFGFTLVREEPHHSFGHELIGQVWELDLRKAQKSDGMIIHSTE